MYCKRCGAQLKESATFCPKCGTKIVKNTLPTTEQILSNIDNLPETEIEGKSEVRGTDYTTHSQESETFESSKQEETFTQEEISSKKNKARLKKWVVVVIILFVVVIAGATVLLLGKKAQDSSEDNATTMELVEESDVVVETEKKATEEIEKTGFEKKETVGSSVTAKKDTEIITEAETETSLSVFVGSGMLESEGNVASEEKEIETAMASSIEETKAPKKQTGWVKSGGVYYYYDSNGSMIKGWLNTGGQKYYLNSAGVMVTGWNNISGTYYFFDASGAMVKGWLQDGGKWYYLDSNGKMLSGGWHSISGNYYYLGNDGALWVNTTTPDGYSVDGNGRRVSENTSSTDPVSGTFTYDDGESYYEDTDTGEITYHYKITLKMKKGGTYEIKISNGKEKTSGTGHYVYDEEDGTIDFTGTINTSGYCDGDYIEIVLDEIGEVYLEK